MNQCWQLKREYNATLGSGFVGYRNNKEKFMEKVIAESESNLNSLYNFDELRKRVQSVFDGPKERIPPIQKINYDNNIEKLEIYQTKIVEKKEIHLAALITKLNISDWVRQGHEHVKNSDGICPFCQQFLPMNFEENLTEYFDETYNNQIQILYSAIKHYRNTVRSLSKYVISLIENNNIPYLNIESIKTNFELIKKVYEANMQLFKQKVNEPSRVITINSINDQIENINNEIDLANLQIEEHNRIIANLKTEKKILKKDIWRFIVDKVSVNYRQYKEKTRGINSDISEMSNKINKLTQENVEITNNNIKLQNQLSSILPTVNIINSLLKTYGFTNFQLAESENEGYYKIIRENGDDAKRTLSEGEKTFITFLYFYQLIDGSFNKEKVNTKRIIVIDDPISSLDSNILFIVSTLINNLKERIRRNDSNYVQLILLTHNVYFHKEVSFNKDLKYRKKNDESFWILRKKDNISYIEEHEENPVRNSYELLWRELKEHTHSITAPNIMRRILENYFKFFGTIDVYDIINEIPDEEKFVCRALLSWVNDGSHHINDDLYIASNQEINTLHFKVFKRIFQLSGHYPHFKMMMGDYPVNREEALKHKVSIGLGEVAATRENYNN